MKTYIGVKRIQAEPQERNGNPGYRVIYEPDGYESWSPKDVFEAAYLPIKEHSKLTDDDINNFIDASKIHVEKRGEKSTLVEIELSLADLGNWPHKGVMPMQNEKSAEKIYREEERWRQNIEAQRRVLRSAHDWLGSAHQ